MFEYRLLDAQLRNAERQRDAEQQRLAARIRQAKSRPNGRVRRAFGLRIAIAR